MDKNEISLEQRREDLDRAGDEAQLEAARWLVAHLKGQKSPEFDEALQRLRSASSRYDKTKRRLEKR